MLQSCNGIRKCNISAGYAEALKNWNETIILIKLLEVQEGKLASGTVVLQSYFFFFGGERFNCILLRESIWIVARVNWNSCETPLELVARLYLFEQKSHSQSCMTWRVKTSCHESQIVYAAKHLLLPFSLCHFFGLSHSTTFTHDVICNYQDNKSSSSRSFQRVVVACKTTTTTTTIRWLW